MVADDEPGTSGGAGSNDTGAHPDTSPGAPVYPPPEPAAVTLRAALIARGALPWREALEAIAGIAGALDVAHAGTPPVVHRELTPENVALTASGEVTLLPRARASAATSSGALRYMSPEQIDARPLDVRSDLYVAGLLLYEALAGAPPFASSSPRELMNMQCTAEPPPLPEALRRELPRGVETLLLALLAKDPVDRVPCAKELILRITPFLPSSVVDRPDPATAPARAWRRAARGRVRAGGVGAWLGTARAVPNALVVLAVALLSIAAAVTTYVIRTSPALERGGESATAPSR
jgi:hypothetical protein